MPEPMLHWRLLEDGIEDPFLHFAMEETLLRRVADGVSMPTLRLRHTLPSVWIGVYQDPREDVDLDYCQVRELPVLRRPNPGGAVYQDAGTFCYTAFFPKNPTLSALGAAETRDLYAVMGSLVVELCSCYGVTAEASPVNDVLANGRKVYGSAQIELGPAIAHSGSFLVNADLEAMEAALRPSRLKFADKGFTNVRDRVVNLSEVAGCPISVAEAMAQFVQTFEDRLPIHLEPGSLTPAELKEAEALCLSKYATREWTFPQRKPFVTSLATKARSGVVVLDLELEGDRIAAIEIKGDFLVERQEDLSSFLRDARNQNIEETLNLLSHSALPTDLQEALAHLIRDGFDRGILPKEGRS